MRSIRSGNVFARAVAITGATLVGIVTLVAARASARSPSARTGDPYTALSAPVRAELERRGCRAPQRRDADRSTVATGVLFDVARRAAPQDVAVACMHDSTRVLLVFRGESAMVAAELSLWSTPMRLPTDSGMVETCEGGIWLVGAKEMLPLVRNGQRADDGRLDARERRAAIHDGVLDGDCDGLSVIHYWTGRRWVILPGTD